MKIPVAIIIGIKERKIKQEIMDDEDHDHLPAHMRNVSTKKRGWAGDEMEMNHKIQQLSSSTTTTAVDLKQFRNEEVGIGYQSKGVIRQRGIGDYHEEKEYKIVDMSKKPIMEKNQQSSSSEDEDDYESSIHSRNKHKKSKKESKRKRKRKDEKERKVHREKKKEQHEENNNNVIDKYLQCEAVRIFRKEIEKIVKETTST